MSLTAKFRLWLFRWKSDGIAPVVLTQRRIFIVPTPTGLLFAVAVAVMLIGAINYNLGLGHALVFLLAGLGFIGMVHTFRNLFGLTISPGRADPVFAGEIAHFPLYLSHNRSSPRLALNFRVDNNPLVSCDLLANSQVSVAMPVLAERRGWLDLPRVRLATTYPLGLFLAWSYLSPAVRCLIYPKPLELPLPQLTPVAHAGTRQGDGGQEDFSNLRERQPADSPRHIAWKAAARSENSPLLIKQFAGGAQSELWLDWNFLPENMPPETRLSVLTGWILEADAQGARYGLRLPGCNVEPAHGLLHRQRCLEQLALASF